MTVEIQDPRELRLSGTTKELLSQVTEAGERLLSHRPFTQTVGERIRAELLPERVTASLNMEGIVATRRQTLAVMDAVRISESPERGELEIFNALKADEFIHDSVEEGLVLTEQVVREVNRLMLDTIRSDAGVFRSGAVELPGAPFFPPPSGDVPDLVRKLCDLYPLGESVHPVLQAAWVHAQFTLIHPFSDGNGRTGRLLQDYTLLRRGLMPIGIPPSQRDDYYGALEEGDQGKWDTMVELLADLELQMLAKVQAIATEPERRTRWIEKLSFAASERATNTAHKKYVVWRQRAQLISNSFGQAAAELDESSYVIGATHREFGALDFKSWQDICRFGLINRSWLFTVLLFAEGKPFYKTVAYSKRHVPTSWDPFPPPQDAVAIYFTGVNPASEDRPDFTAYSDPHVRLRELVYADDELVVFKQEAGEDSWSVGQEETVEDVVENYFMDMFGRKAGLAL